MTSTPRPLRLSDHRQARDHLRACVDPLRYGQPTVLVVSCDATSAPLHHVEVVACDPDSTVTESALVLDNLLATLEHSGQLDKTDALLLGLTRSGGEQVQPFDRIWFRALHRVCHARGIDPLGVYIVGRHGARQVHIDDAA